MFSKWFFKQIRFGLNFIVPLTIIKLMYKVCKLMKQPSVTVKRSIKMMYSVFVLLCCVLTVVKYDYLNKLSLR